MNKKQTNAYITKRGVLLPNGQVFLRAPLFAFKKIFTYSFDADESYDRILGKMHWANRSSTLETLRKRIINEKRITHGIANLIIPAGAIVNLAPTSNLKLRSSVAYCHSIYRMSGTAVAVGRSSNDENFTYLSSQETAYNHHIQNADLKKGHGIGNLHSKTSLILPANGFCTTREECAPGVHFFIDIEEAKDYYI